MARKRKNKTNQSNPRSNGYVGNSSPKGGERPAEGKTPSAPTPKEPTPKEPEPTGPDGKPVHYRSADPANDPEWYLKFPELAFGAANLPWSESFGTPMKYGDASVASVAGGAQTAKGLNITDHSNAVPGVATLFIKPSYGSNRDRNDVMNIAAQQFFTNVRYVNAGRKNYEPADLMIYNITVAELMSFIGWCQRAYALAFMYSQRNLYVGKTMLEAQHINAESICSNLANFRYWINTFITKISGWAMPGDINIFKRRIYMYSNIYTESTTGNLKDQLYQYAPDGFYQFQLENGTDAGCVIYRTLPDLIGSPTDPSEDSVWTMGATDIMKIGDELISTIYGDEDFALMSGDIIKAYGNNVLSLNAVAEAVLILPVYEEFTLSQMRNATVFNVQRGRNAADVDPNAAGRKFGNIYQTGGNLISTEGMVYTDAKDAVADFYLLNSGIITSTNPLPGISDTLEATRLKLCGDINLQEKVNPLGDNGRYVLSCGSDIVVGVGITQYSWRDNGEGHVVWHDWVNVFTHNGVAVIDPPTSQDKIAGWTALSEQCEWLNAFHWLPLRWLISYNSSYKITKVTPLSNLDNYTTVTRRNLMHMHEVCLLSLTSVPGVVTLVN